MRDDDSLFPRSFGGRLRLGLESSFFLCVGVYSVLHWPPVGVVAQGIWVNVFLAIIFEMMLVSIPMGLLGLWWALATPDWIRTTLKRVSAHATAIVLGLLGLGLLGMVAGALGWW